MCFVGNKKGALKEIGTFMMTTCFIANYQSVQVSQVSGGTNRDISSVSWPQVDSSIWFSCQRCVTVQLVVL
ncbi:hypothetical protein YC2023_096279 [Brassica napus]